VLPVLNEVDAIEWVLDRFPGGYRAIVADNGSTDGSGDRARQHGALVVEVAQPGFGSPAGRGWRRQRTTSVLRAGNAGWRVTEVEVPYRCRQGRSKVTGTVGGTLRAVRDMRRQLRELG